MIALPATLVAALWLAAVDPLAAAIEAFSAHRYEDAEALALSAAEQSAPRNGAALYLAGLARFRSGRPEEALEALNAAGLAPDAPARAQWQFNRAACLYELGRFREAEQAYLEAAADPALARVAYANAGFAALDAGAPDRARRLADRAREGATDAELALVEDLLAQLESDGEPEPESPPDDTYANALDAFDRGRFEEARAGFLEVAREDPSLGRARLMAGAAAYRLGDRARAEEDVRASLALKLSAGEADVARQYLDRLSFGLRSEREGLQTWVTVGAGFDTNPLQMGFAQREVLAGRMGPRTGSPFASVYLAAVHRLELGDVWSARFSYAGEQRAYASFVARDYSIQAHRLTAAAERSMARFRLGASANGDVAFTGLDALRGLQAAATGSAWFAFDESAITSSRVDLSFSRKLGLSDEFSYLSGGRYDVTASQWLRVGMRWAQAWYRFRSDDTGTLELDDPLGRFVVPFAYRSHAVGVSARAPLADWLDAELEVSGERRRATEETYLRMLASDGTTSIVNRRRREDTRLTLAPALTFRLSPRLGVSAEYELIINRSNIDARLADPPGACAAPDYSCHALDYSNENYTKHVFTVGFGGTW